MTFLELWELYMSSRPLRPGTLRNYKYKLKKFKEIHDREAGDISSEMIQKMYNKVKLPSSKYDYDFVTLKSVFNYAIVLGEISKNPVQLRLKKAPPSCLHELLTKEKIANLIKELCSSQEKVRLMLLIELLTGSRVSEIRALRKKDIDLKNNVISIKNQYQISDVSGVEGLCELKTRNSERLVYIPEILQKKLGVAIKELNKDDFIFNNRSKPFTVAHINKVLSDVCEEIEIERLTTHDLRSLYATMALYSNANIVSIAGQMGHASLIPTLRYLRRIEAVDIKLREQIEDFLKECR